MKKTARIREYGIQIGKLPRGEKNLITDVPGVKVGHVTLSREGLQTGVTAILPHDGNLFRDKVVAATHVINGFGKSIGLMQIDELGTLETPIVLTNTLNVGLAADGLVEYMLQQNPEIGVKTGTVNPVVCECNDAYLNDVRNRGVKQAHIKQAIEKASADFQEGAVGAGRGMSCYHLKGGIGSSSRVISLRDVDFTLGVLVLSNLVNGAICWWMAGKWGVKLKNACKASPLRKTKGQ